MAKMLFILTADCYATWMSFEDIGMLNFAFQNRDQLLNPLNGFADSSH